MPKRRDNMLEALKASADEALEARRQELALAPRRARAATPTGDERAPRAERDLPPEPEFEEESGVTLPMGFAPFLVLQLVLLALVFWMGVVAGRPELAPVENTRTGGEVRLDDPLAAPVKKAGDPVLGHAAEASAASADARRAPDVAIESAANRVTVMVAQYNDTGYGQDRARDAFAYLLEQGYPVVTPRQRNGLIMLFVGAAPAVDELKGLQSELESLRGPSGEPNYFRSPFIVNIDDYL